MRWRKKNCLKNKVGGGVEEGRRWEGEKRHVLVVGVCFETGFFYAALVVPELKLTL